MGVIKAIFFREFQPIYGFLVQAELNFRSLIQPLKTLPMELTGIHY